MGRLHSSTKHLRDIFLKNSRRYLDTTVTPGFPGGASGKEPVCNAGDPRVTGLILGPGRSPWTKLKRLSVHAGDTWTPLAQKDTLLLSR